MTETRNSPQTALLEGPEETEKPKATAVAPLIAEVHKKYGVHPLRQMQEILSMRMTSQKLGSNEYYNLCLFDPEVPAAQKKEFLGQGGSNALNNAMNPISVVQTRAFVCNKLLYTQLLDQLGLPTAQTQALVRTSKFVGRLRTLQNAEALERFLGKDATYPVFGKPLFGSQSVGSVRLDSMSGKNLKLANGTVLPATKFAAEVIERFPSGFLLQSALEPHPDMAAIAGPAIGCIRVVTANDGSGPKPVYALWKLPAPQAMSDNFWQQNSLLAELDLESGNVLSCRRGTGLQGELYDFHPISGAKVVGETLPFWRETLELAIDAHLIFPEFGVCGFDIAITTKGPSILECNDNPAHMLYQYATRRGIQNPEFACIWEAVIKRQNKRVALQKAAIRKSK